MASRGSALSRAIRFFREGDIDECRVALVLINEIMVEREHPKIKVKRGPRARKPSVATTATSGVVTQAVEA